MMATGETGRARITNQKKTPKKTSKYVAPAKSADTPAKRAPRTPRKAPETVPEGTVAPEQVPDDSKPAESRVWPPADLETKEPGQYDKKWGVPDGIILEAGEEDRFEADDMGSYLIVTVDVYRKIIPRGSQRPTFLLLHPKGQHLPKMPYHQL